MAEFICRCCGGQLEQVGESTLYICAFCGMKQTVPRFTESQRSNLYSRAEQLRSAGEFDRAAAIYEQMTADIPQSAELWWALLLCRYGVTYVLDGDRAIPTINRARRTSVLADEAFRMVEECSDREMLGHYRSQAQELDDIQRRLLAVSDSEQPFDIFICYKEDDGRGGRTYESLLAQEIYKRFTDEGRRVFFARITLEDKPGSEYEPVIFSALNSARVMLAVGFTREHFEAPWVRNEWSRFLALPDDRRLVIPVFSGNIAAIPQELSGYQAVDAGQLGFMENIAAAVDRVLPQTGSVATDDPDGLLARAYRCLASGEFTTADQLCEQLLDSDPENGEAYIAKLLAELHIHSLEQIPQLGRDITDTPAWEKAMRYADEPQKGTLLEYVRTGVLGVAARLRGTSEDPQELNDIAARLDRLGCVEEAEKCRARAGELFAEQEETRRRSQYDYALSILQNSRNADELSTAHDIFVSLGEYRDSPSLAERCRISSENRSAEDIRLTEEARSQQENRLSYFKRRNRIITASVAGTAAAAVIITGAVLIAGNVHRGAEHSAGMEDLRSGNYASAVEHFDSAGDYSNSAEMKRQAEYQLALQLRENMQYDEAAEIFTRLGSYENSADEVKSTMFQKACWQRENGDFDAAESGFMLLGDYGTSSEEILRTRYMQAENHLEKGELDLAAKLFSGLGEYSDSSDRLGEVHYRRAELLLQAGEFSAAAKMFENSQSGDWEQRVCEARYMQAEQTAVTDSEQAAEMFAELGEYSDSEERSNALYYQTAEEALASGNSARAVELFTQLGGYSDSAERLTEAKYSLAVECLSDGKPQEAADIFAVLGDYRDSAEQLKEAKSRIKSLFLTGTVVEFGRWEQDGDLSSTEPIKWVVVSNDGDKAVLFSEYIIDQRAYDGANWAESGLRSWLNGTFLNSAFTEAERSRLCAVMKEYWNYDELKKQGEVSDLVTIPDYRDGLRKNYDTICTVYADSIRSGGVGDKVFWLRSFNHGIPMLGNNGTATITNPYPTGGVLPVITIDLHK